jgi:NitT/TauT family transport system ATP-binding protein
MPVMISAQAICKRYSAQSGVVTAVQDFSLEVQEGEFVCIVGPSGCGKSTFLRILGGLIEPSGGQVKWGAGRPGLPLQNIVFQEYAIFPWKTVLNNVAFGLEMRGLPAADRREQALGWLRRVGLSKFADAYPHQLSGGMKQRVSIARAFANDPAVLLMDEPLGALDAQTRAVLQEELISLWESSGKTVVYITHNIEEAVLLGDRVVLMTAHPGTYKCEFPVPFPRPRRYELTSTPEFGRLSYAIWRELEGEVRRAMEVEQ